MAQQKRQIPLMVNGERHVVSVHDDEPLVFVLRNQLGLTGAKLGCGLEQCGACAVLVDGVSTLTCITPATTFTDKAITTVEGLASDAALTPLQQAFIDCRAAQCGYCTAGMLIATTALLATEPKPSDTQIRAALRPHLCRCGCHPRVLAAIAQVTA